MQYYIIGNTRWENVQRLDNFVILTSAFSEANRSEFRTVWHSKTGTVNVSSLLFVGGPAVDVSIHMKLYAEK